MATIGEQVAKISHDKALPKRRIQVVVHYREDNHKIRHMHGKWFEVSDGQDVEKAARFALEQTLEKGFSNVPAGR